MTRNALSFQVNNQSQCNVHVYVQATAANCDITYINSSTQASTSVGFTGTNVLSNVIALSDVQNGTFTINKLIAGVFYFTYDSTFASLAGAPSIATSTVPFSVVELTRNNPPVAGDAGDLTAINFFTAPIELQSFNGTQQLQTKSFSAPTSDIFSQLYALAPGAIVSNAGAAVRVLSAYEYATQQIDSPYPRFDGYLSAVAAAGQFTTIQNSSAWNNPVNTSSGNYTNYNFQFNFAATVEQSTPGSYCDVRLKNGTVSVTAITYTANQPSAPVNTTIASDLTIVLSGSDDALLNQLIYGQTINGTVTFSDSGTQGWDALATYIQNNVSGQSVEDTLKSLIIGEITSGFVFGFINSNETPAGQAQAIKTMPSDQWWSLNPNDGYSTAQPTAPYYDPYAAVICAASGNQVYGAAYGDRFTDPAQNPTIESSFYNGQAVTAWSVTLLPPISCPPTVAATVGAVMECGVVVMAQVLHPDTVIP